MFLYKGIFEQTADKNRTLLPYGSTRIQFNSSIKIEKYSLSQILLVIGEGSKKLRIIESESIRRLSLETFLSFIYRLLESLFIGSGKPYS